MDCRETFRAARQRLTQRVTPTSWADAGPSRHPEWFMDGDAPFAGGTVYELGYTARLAAPPDVVWPALEAIGGERGWYFADVLWKIRGLVDRLVGGPGLGPGRKHPPCLLAGDALDCWRVLESEPPGRLTLLATMKSPGEAVLVFTLRATPRGETVIDLLARFLPHGLAGLAYWYAMYPAHIVLFSGLIKRLAASADAPLASGPDRTTPALP